MGLAHGPVGQLAHVVLIPDVFGVLGFVSKRKKIVFLKEIVVYFDQRMHACACVCMFENNVFMARRKNFLCHNKWQKLLRKISAINNQIEYDWLNLSFVYSKKQQP